MSRWRRRFIQQNLKRDLVIAVDQGPPKGSKQEADLDSSAFHWDFKNWYQSNSSQSSLDRDMETRIGKVDQLTE